MKALASAVGAFALATLLVAFHTPDTMAFLLAAAALACAVATFLSRRLSTFLRIFETIFAVETVVFGLAFLANKLGFWPKAYADYALPDSLPLTVALFGAFVFAISFIPVIRKMTRIANPYFEEDAPTSARLWPFRSFVMAQKKLAGAALVFLIVINQAQVALDVRLSFFSRDFYNALQNKDQPEFTRQLGFVFLPFASILIAGSIETATAWLITAVMVSIHYCPLRLAMPPACQRSCQTLSGRPRQSTCRASRAASCDAARVVHQRDDVIGYRGRCRRWPMVKSLMCAVGVAAIMSMVTPASSFAGGDRSDGLSAPSRTWRAGVRNGRVHSGYAHGGRHRLVRP
jgi:hypothetical protein